ncbi:MAG TPA: zf-HC2 domain-containing protein [Acidimicrobiia bacterium]
MDDLSCAATRELAPELALGVLDGAERAEALAHVERCASCRALVGDLTGAVETLPLAAPEAEPPPGFEDRVLRALGAGRRRARLRWARVVAVTAAAAAIVSIVVVRVVDRGRDDPATPAVSTEAVSDVWAAPMVDANGHDVGWAFVSDGTPAAIGLAMSYAIPNGEYTIEVRRSDGTTAELGEVAILDGRGTWAGTAPTKRGDVVAVSLVDAAGALVCTATPIA